MSDIHSFFQQYTEALRAEQQRGFIRLAGEQFWAYQQLDFILAEPDTIAFLEPDELRNAEHKDKNEWRLKKYKRYLGQECQYLVYDAYQGFNCDAIAALAGLIRSGGVLILITPKNQDWLQFDDPEASRFFAEKADRALHKNTFFSYLIDALYSSKVVTTIEQGDNVDGSIIPGVGKPENYLPTSQWAKKPQAASKAIEKNSPIKQPPAPFKTLDQKSVSEELVTFYQSPAPADKFNAVLLTADRGRGKSSVLGLSLADWLNKSNDLPNVAIVSSAREATLTLELHFLAQLEDKNKRQCLEFLTPDCALERMAKGQLNFDAVIIDEAATIPISIIQQITYATKKLILSTTIHGYEGTGRGFEYKLKPWLALYSEQLETLSLNEPIRWSNNDELEKLINDIFCLNKVDLNRAQCPATKSLTTSWLTAESKTSPLLFDAFALLSHAHYQTSPNDLRIMMDSPTMQTVVMLQDQQVVAAATISLEGGFDSVEDEALIEGIWQGKRRPRGHLTAQSLSAHCGYKSAMLYQYARIVRIAVLPQFQSQGLGTELLKKIATHYSQQGDIDFLSTSFGFDAALYNFWQAGGFEAVRLGIKPDSSTGLVSLLMLKPLKTSVELECQRWQQRFVSTILAEQAIHFRSSHETSLASINMQALNTVDKDSDWMIKQHKVDVELLAYHARSPDSCVLAVRWLLQSLPKVESSLLNDKYCLGLDNAELINKYRLTGEKQLVRAIRENVSNILNTYVIKPRA